MRRKSFLHKCSFLLLFPDSWLIPGLDPGSRSVESPGSGAEQLWVLFQNQRTSGQKDPPQSLIQAASNPDCNPAVAVPP